MPTLALLRHGQSEWDEENRFSGWADVDLSARGKDEARAAGRALLRQGFGFDIAYTSVLKRAIRTTWIVLDQLDSMYIPVHTSWRLNERHFGALQGLNKLETTVRFGEEQVNLWRRSYDLRPPQLRATDERHCGSDPRYRQLRQHELPLGESLKDTESRLWPYWRHSIAKALRENERVLVVAHGNSLRALVKHLSEISDDGIGEIEIPCGIPLIYELDHHLGRIGSYYLDEPDELPAAQTRIRTNSQETAAA